MEEENAKERSNREINNKDKSIFIINSSITNHMRYYNNNLIIPAIAVYILVLVYAVWSNSKKQSRSYKTCTRSNNRYKLNNKKTH